MSTNFITDTSSGPRAALDVRGTWVFTIFMMLNELRGLFSAYEGAQWMGWI